MLMISVKCCTIIYFSKTKLWIY